MHKVKHNERSGLCVVWLLKICRQNCFWRSGFTSDVNQVYTNLAIRSWSLPDDYDKIQWI